MEVQDLIPMNRARLKLLVQNSILTGKELEDAKQEWMRKLHNKEWIEGTPWNIPESQKKDIVKHFNDTV